MRVKHALGRDRRAVLVITTHKQLIELLDLLQVERLVPLLQVLPPLAEFLVLLRVSRHQRRVVLASRILEVIELLDILLDEWHDLRLMLQHVKLRLLPLRGDLPELFALNDQVLELPGEAALLVGFIHVLRGWPGFGLALAPDLLLEEDLAALALILEVLSLIDILLYLHPHLRLMGLQLMQNRHSTLSLIPDKVTVLCELHPAVNMRQLGLPVEVISLED